MKSICETPERFNDTRAVLKRKIMAKMTKTPQSACAFLMKKTYKDVWMRGVEYARNGHVEIVSMDDRHIEATVKGTESYRVNLKR